MNLNWLERGRDYLGGVVRALVSMATPIANPVRVPEPHELILDVKDQDSSGDARFIEAWQNGNVRVTVCRPDQTVTQLAVTGGILSHCWFNTNCTVMSELGYPREQDIPDPVKHRFHSGMPHPAARRRATASAVPFRFSPT
jgi:hypothetical protein